MDNITVDGVEYPVLDLWELVPDYGGDRNYRNIRCVEPGVYETEETEISIRSIYWSQRIMADAMRAANWTEHRIDRFFNADP